MKAEPRARWALLLALLAVFSGGCVGVQYSEFRGILAHGATATNAPTVQEIGAEFQHLPERSAEALTGYHLSPSRFILVFVHDRQKYVKQDYRLSNDAVSAIYVSEGGLCGERAWMKFLGQDAAARDQSEGMHRLHGSFNVERWKSNIDFRIGLAMQSEGPDPVTVDGMLTTYDRWEIRPWLALGLILGSMGLISE